MGASQEPRCEHADALASSQCDEQQQATAGNSLSEQPPPARALDASGILYAIHRVIVSLGLVVFVAGESESYITGRLIQTSIIRMYRRCWL